MRFAFSLLTTLLVSGCATQPASEYLDDNGLQAALVNGKIVEDSQAGENILRLYPDGRATLAGPNEAWSGAWEIAGDRLCLSARSKCYQVGHIRGRHYTAHTENNDPVGWYLMKRLNESANNYD